MHAIVCGGEGEPGIWRWSLADFTEEPQPLTPAQVREQALKDAATSYHCRFCDKLYKRPKSMRTHEAKKCPRRPFSFSGDAEADIKMLHCSTCRTGYAHSEALQRHERVCLSKNSSSSSSSSSSTCTPRPWGRVDGINNYALRYVNEGLLSMAFRDLIRFGNGEACVRFYKWILPLSRIHSSHAKYATEALYLYTSVNFLLSPRMALKLTWNRFCCTVNRRGRNIPGDRRIEHLNRLAKAFLAASGHQNLSDKLVDDIGSAIQPLYDLGRNFDRVSSVPQPHRYIDRDSVNTGDEAIMLQQLLTADVFSFIPGRHHADFVGIKANPFEDLDQAKLRTYVLSWGKTYAAWQRAGYSRLYVIPR